MREGAMCYKMSEYTVKSYSKPYMLIEGESKCGLFLVIETNGFGDIFVSTGKSIAEAKESNHLTKVRVDPEYIYLRVIKKLLKEERIVDWSDSVPSYKGKAEESIYLSSIGPHEKVSFRGEKG